MLVRVGIGELHNFFQQLPQIGLLNVQFPWAGEVDQNLHYAVQTMNFASDNVHVTARIGIDLLQLALQ